MCAPTERNELMQEANWLGKEKPHASREEELEGIRTILSTLDTAEIDLIQQIDTSIPIRHLRAQKGNLAKAVTSIRSTLAFRKDFFAHPVEVDSPALRQQIAPDVRTGRSYVRGYDRDGRAISIAKFVPQHYQNDEKTEQYLMWNIEKAIACTKRKSGYEKFIVVMDYEGYNRTYEAPFSLTKRFVTNLQHHYPERTYKVYIVNAPVSFRVFYALMKPFIDPDTTSKIVFSSSSDMRPLMEDMVEDPDNMESFMGGTHAVRVFDADEYLAIPFDRAFDES